MNLGGRLNVFDWSAKPVSRGNRSRSFRDGQGMDGCMGRWISGGMDIVIDRQMDHWMDDWMDCFMDSKQLMT